MFHWVKKNKEWVFSGIGTSLIVLVLSLFLGSQDRESDGIRKLNPEFFNSSTSFPDTFIVNSGTEIDVLGDPPQEFLRDALKSSGLPSTMPNALESFLKLYSPTTTKVKIISGNHTGKVGWVPTFFIKKEQIPITESP